MCFILQSSFSIKRDIRHLQNDLNGIEQYQAIHSGYRVKLQTQ